MTVSIPLTPEQREQLRPLFEHQQRQGSPDSIAVGEIRREDWTRGAQIVLRASLVPRAIVEKMRRVWVKEMQKRRAEA